MLRAKLEHLAARAVAALIGALEALFELAWRHRRMTSKGVTAAVVFVAARYGLEISAETQTALAVGVSLYLGVAGRDRGRVDRRKTAT